MDTGEIGLFHALRTSLVQQAFAAACIPQLALIQNGQIFTGFLNVADNVSGEEYRLFPGKFPEQLPEPDPFLWIQPRGGLVGYDDLRVVERPGQIGLPSVRVLEFSSAGAASASRKAQTNSPALHTRSWMGTWKTPGGDSLSFP